MMQQISKTRIVFFFFLFAFLTTRVSAQVFVVKGKIIDTAGARHIYEASVIILHEKDSLLVADTRSSQDGSFLFNNLKKGKYILLVTYPNYADYTEHFALDTVPEIKLFNNINLTRKEVLLKEVLIKSRRVSAVRFKGDTTEFDAGSFHVKPNATVEDLLKQLPGLNVDRDGKITAYGKPVEKVLVDGEEFFGDDPTLITKNLKAEIVDKVQLYDKTSDQAAFTGVDDGQKSKTIDLKLKKDQKFGYFGEIEASGGTNGFYQNQAMFNKFAGDEKIAGYFIQNNTGKIGLDNEAQKNYADGDDNPIKNELDSWDGTYGGEGIPRSITGGLHYDNKWNNDKEAINANYKIGNLDIAGQEKNINQNNVPGSPLYSTTAGKNKNQLMRHGLNIAYALKLDSTSELKLSVAGMLLNKTTSEADSSVTREENFAALNNSVKNIATNGETNAFNSNILWLKKFKKERRTVSINFNTIINDNNGTGNFYTKSNFFDGTGKLDSTQIINQYKKTDNHAEFYGLKATYSEPLGNNGTVVVNYGVFAENAAAELQTFNKSSLGIAVNTLDSLYSNDYQFNQFSNKGGLAYIYKVKKARVQFGSDVESDEFNQRNLFNNSVLPRSFINWYPRAEFQYNITSYKSVSFNYSGNTIQPTIQQIQPVINNNDPLNKYVGNAFLKPMFNNDFSTSYQFFKGSKYLDVRGDYSFTDRPITISVQTDDITGSSINTFVNLDSKQTSTYSATFLFRDKLKLWNLDYGADGGINGAKYASIANGLINATNASIYRLNFIVSKSVDSVYYLGASFGANYNINNNSLQPSTNNNSWGYILNPYIDFYFHGILQIHTDGNYSWQGKTQAFNTNFSRFIWNISLEKQLVTKKNVLLRLSANDILNQNVGFNRSAYANIITQNTYNTIARYFMISLVWDFNKTGNKAN